MNAARYKIAVSFCPCHVSLHGDALQQFGEDRFETLLLDEFEGFLFSRLFHGLVDKSLAVCVHACMLV